MIDLRSPIEPQELLDEYRAAVREIALVRAALTLRGALARRSRVAERDVRDADETFRAHAGDAAVAAVADGLGTLDAERATWRRVERASEAAGGDLRLADDTAVARDLLEEAWRLLCDVDDRHLALAGLSQVVAGRLDTPAVRGSWASARRSFDDLVGALRDGVEHLLALNDRRRRVRDALPEPERVACPWWSERADCDLARVYGRVGASEPSSEPDPHIEGCEPCKTLEAELRDLPRALAGLPPPDLHPTPEELCALAEGEMDETASRLLRRHIDECRSCAEEYRLVLADVEGERGQAADETADETAGEAAIGSPAAAAPFAVAYLPALRRDAAVHVHAQEDEGLPDPERGVRIAEFPAEEVAVYVFPGALEYRIVAYFTDGTRFREVRGPGVRETARLATGWVGAFEPSGPTASVEVVTAGGTYPVTLLVP